MSRDISSRDDLMIIVRDFYDLLFQSEDLKHFFEEFRNETALEHHLDILVDFWDNTLFYSGSYKKNAMKPPVCKICDAMLSEEGGGLGYLFRPIR